MSFKEILVGGPKFKFLKEKSLNFNNLSDYPFIGLGKETATYNFYHNIYIKNNLIYKPDIEVATINQILPIVEHNIGIAFLPKIFADETIKKQQIYQLNLIDKIPLRDICIVKNSDYPLNIASLKFIDMLCN